MSRRHLWILTLIVLFVVLTFSVVDRAIWASKLAGAVNSKVLFEATGYDMTPICSHKEGPNLEYAIQDNELVFRCAAWGAGLVFWPFYNTGKLERTPARMEMLTLLGRSPE